jgi:pimeloyl-ACP methyl ester carboxylesterase
VVALLDVDPDPVFGTFHDAAEPRRATAVLILPPWGWDEITSYRARRAWARDLAGSGWPTLRIDLPGAGDSAGEPGDPDRVLAWRRAVGGAAAWLRARPGIERVAAIGLGLGGLAAGAAVADGAPIDELVLWGAPDTGQAWLREQRAFAALQTSHNEPAAGADGGAANGAGARATTNGSAAAAPGVDLLEIGGFALSASTVTDVRGLVLTELLPGRLDRALLLDRDGMPVSRKLVEALAGGGTEVTQAAGTGWSKTVFHPEQYFEPVAIFRTVASWLACGERRQPSAARSTTTVPVPPERDVLEIRQANVSIRERPIRIEEPFGELFGIQAEPADRAHGDLVAVFLNAGAIRRVGPNRLWVETARRWAARGVPSVRMDLEGLGDADGDPRRYADVGKFYTPAFGAQVASIVDDVVRRGLGTRVVLVGLCAGAYWAFHTAAEDDRIVESIILNPRAMIWDDGLLERREAKKVTQVLDGGAWKRLASGDIELSRLVDVSRALAGSAAGAAKRTPARIATRFRSGPAADPIERLMDALRDRGIRLVLAFSGDEPVHDELAADGILEGLDRWPNTQLVSLPAADHTLRPLEAQAAAASLLAAELERLLASR